jgi:hypothetical protein
MKDDIGAGRRTLAHPWSFLLDQLEGARRQERGPSRLKHRETGSTAVLTLREIEIVQVHVMLWHLLHRFPCFYISACRGRLALRPER